MRTQISEVLDMELIGQQAASDTVDIQGLASYIISTMGKLCAPVRDEEVKGLQEARGNVVTLFKYAVHVTSLVLPSQIKRNHKSKFTMKWLMGGLIWKDHQTALL